MSVDARLLADITTAMRRHGEDWWRAFEFWDYELCGWRSAMHPEVIYIALETGAVRLRAEPTP